jgi:hypothetical protein
MKDGADCSAVSNALCIILYGDMMKWLGTIISEKPACGFDCQKFVGRHKRKESKECIFSERYRTLTDGNIQLATF